MKRFMSILLSIIFMCSMTVNAFASNGYLETEPIYAVSADSSTYQDANGYHHRSWGVIDMRADIFADYVADNSNGIVKVAVIDSGAETNHPFISDRIMTTSRCDIVDNDNTPEDLVGDGTYIASVIADCTPGLNVNILPIKVTESGNGIDIDKVVEGINHAISCDVDIIQVACWGEDFETTPEAQGTEEINAAIDLALSNGIIVVTSAGDENTSTYSMCPATRNDIIVVSAVNSAYDKYSASNSGISVDLTAPGANVKCAAPYSKYSNGYASTSSTKIAAAHITACAAMLKLLYPSYTPSQIESVLKSCAIDLGAAGKDNIYGYGIPDLMELVTYLPFSDVLASSYYYDGVYELYTRGYMKGQNSDTFGPTLNMQRQDAAVLYYRMAGTPSVTFTQIYDDVGYTDYFANAAIWAKNTGVITGLTNTHLGVGDYITREAFALTLYRYANYKGLNTSASANISGYTDANSVSGFAVPAVKWAVAKGLMGQGTSSLNPQGYIMRQDIAVMIYRFLQAYNL